MSNTEPMTPDCSRWQGLDRLLARMRPQRRPISLLVDGLVIALCWNVTYVFRLGFEHHPHVVRRPRVQPAFEAEAEHVGHVPAQCDHEPVDQQRDRPALRAHARQQPVETLPEGTIGCHGFSV